jgi:hypothetical protein
MPVQEMGAAGATNVEMKNRAQIAQKQLMRRWPAEIVKK